MASDKIPVLVNISTDQVMEFLKERGTLVDVVRCRDCKHYNAGFECLAEGYGIERDPDLYCADGERKVQK